MDGHGGAPQPERGPIEAIDTVKKAGGVKQAQDGCHKDEVLASHESAPVTREQNRHPEEKEIHRRYSGHSGGGTYKCLRVAEQELINVKIPTEEVFDQGQAAD